VFLTHGINLPKNMALLSFGQHHCQPPYI
jgi:hypothetical protein